MSKTYTHMYMHIYIYLYYSHKSHINMKYIRSTLFLVPFKDNLVPYAALATRTGFLPRFLLSFAVHLLLAKHIL